MYFSFVFLQINVSPTLSRHFENEGRSVQTDITMTDFSPTRLLVRKFTNQPLNDVDGIPIRRTETRNVLPKINFYKEYLQSEVLDWLNNVPMFFSLNLTTKDIKDNVVYNLVQNLNALAAEANDKTYEIKTKRKIDDCMNRLPMWLHGTKKDQILFKESLKEKLWNKIVRLNKIFLGVNYPKEADENLDEKVKIFLSYEKEIVDWSLQLLLSPAESVTRRQVVNLLKKRLYPLLKIPLYTTSYKLILKGEIIDILDDSHLTFPSSRFRTVKINKLAEELANRLLNIRIKQESSSDINALISSPLVVHQISSQVKALPIPKTLQNHKDLVWDRVGECLDKLPICNRYNLQTEICSSFLDSKSCLVTEIDEMTVKDEISQSLRDTGKISAVDKAQIIADMIIKHISYELKYATMTATTSFDSVIPELTGAISVYTVESHNFPVTSTPKKAKRKEVPKLSPEETSYIEQVAALITVWINSLPKQYNDEPGFKRTIIYDLAGDIMDHQKLQQLAPDPISDQEKYQKYLIYKWLVKFDFFEESKLRTESVPLVVDLQRKLKNIRVPKLTASQHGTRQEMEHIKHMETGRGWEEDYVAKGIDVLEDQISVWMNEQPSEIYSNKDKVKRNKMVHDLALNLQDHLRNKAGESEIEADINQWLRKVVNPKEREHINLLTQDLKSKVIDLPQDRTLGARHEERHKDIIAKIAAKRQEAAGQPSTQHSEDVSNLGNIQGDPDSTIRQFISKYIEHYYDIDDPMAQGAFAHLLKTELRKLAPPTRQEVYKNFEQLRTHQRFRPESLHNELEYIKIISDWLNNIPIDASYNTVGNKDRIDFINDLARNIQEIEQERNENPNVMNYNYLIASTILTSMNTYDLPIPREHRDKTHLMANQLLEKLANIRPSELPAQKSLTNDSISSSFMMSDIKEQNLSDFINDYIRINGREIADDELKLEAWTARLLKEIKKMVNEDVDPTTLTKAQVYEKFTNVPIPNEESVETFGLKIYYVKEITDWMKNLPLLPMNKNQPKHAEEIIEMISELSEKMCDTEALRKAHPSDTSADKKIEEYIATWISSLPLDKSKEINLPMLVKQLMIRMDKGNKQSPKASLEKQPITAEKHKITSPSSSKKKKEDQKDSYKNLSKKGNMGRCKGKTPAEVIVEAIENWSNKLPIKMDDKETVKAMKEGIARQLYQKIGELNVDPRIFNDELLYREILDDEIETQLENVPQNSELQDKREQIKEGLINQIIGTNKIIKEKSAGDNYRHKLETTINASIPNPVISMQVFDPGFEIYKNHLADMFILENFDHGNDDVKATYEKRVRRTIDEYFASAQNKNALPLTKDQIYNELYSALFKVPMPNENSIIDEVEQVKTRCEIDAWYEKLPIQETDNINELLERDQILSTLAKRIQELEKSEIKSDEKINKEIRKWLDKLPLKPGQQGIDEHVKQLQSLLKSTTVARKYVPPETIAKGKRKQAVVKGKKEAKGPNTSQVPGPSVTYVPPRSSPLKSKATNAKPCCPAVSPVSNKKPGDLIVEIVEEWCEQLPLISTEENNKTIIDNVATRIIIQISELNMDSEIFNDDFIYDELLDEELEKIMANLPVCCDFVKSITARKYQLKEQIKSIKPLIKEEKARHAYKQEVNNTVASILKELHDTSADKLAQFNKLKEEIVENFVQYYYHINDEEARQFYKNQIHDAVVKFCIEIRESVGTAGKVDPLVKRNQLLCELQKIPVPKSALEEEVTEIKMKREVEQFLLEQSVPEGEAKDTMIKHLAKRLSDIEKSGYTPANKKKMITDITRCLTKLKKDVSPEKVDGFVSKLKHNEKERKTPPMTSSQASNLNQERTAPYFCSTSTKPFGTYQSGIPIQTTIPNAYHTPASMHPYAPQVWAWSPNENHPDQNMSQSPAGTDDFRTGNILSSCANPQGAVLRIPPPSARYARPPMNLNVSLGSALPNRRLSQQALNRSYPQYQQNRHMKEANSGSILSTPRQVSQSPRAPQPQGTSMRDTTSDSLFDTPVFEPVPFSIIDPFQWGGSGRPRKPFVGLENARGLPLQAAGRTGDRRPRGAEHSDVDELCVCERCSPRSRRGVPVCLMPMDLSFEGCLGIPLWYGHFPDCIFY